MADHLQSIFGTEKDRVNCPFYFQIGACRHGDKCSRRHNKPSLSQTLIFFNMWRNPIVSNPNADLVKTEEEFEAFYADIYEELSKFGEIDELHVCDNISDHLLGNVYCKFYEEESAEKAMKGLAGRFYAGKPIVAEFSPVTDFRESSCRQYEMNECNRGGYCNFMHLKPVSRDIYRRLFRRKRTSRSRSNSRSRSRSPPRRKRSRSTSRSPDRSHKSRRSRSNSPRERRTSGGDRDRGRDDNRSRRDYREKERDRPRK